jgi:multidrug efflux pump subunit AcrA (membrane-fusion protein)
METYAQPVGWKGKVKSIFVGPKRNRNLIILAIILLLCGYLYYRSASTVTTTSYEYVSAAKKDLKKTVEGSGKVVSVSELQIQQLQGGGKITAVYVKPGDYVKAGQVIATTDNRQQAISLAQSKANYQKVVNGSTQQDLDISNQSLINAQESYNQTLESQNLAVSNAKKNLLNTSIAAIPQIDSVIQPNTPTVTGSYTCTDEKVYDIKFQMPGYVSVDNGVGQVRISNVPQPLGDCGLYLTFDMTKDYSNGEWKIFLPNKVSTSYNSNLNAYNSAIEARDQAMLNASTSVVNARLSLNQKVAGNRPEDIASAYASLQNAQLNYDNTFIRAPFAGQIGAVSAAVGQQTNSQQGVATIITKDKVAQISLNEIDIVNVKLGQSVDLTFDAVPNETFHGTVSEINSVGDNNSNVVTFAVKISIPDADERIKSGMSVTANIITDEKANILTVPASAIKTEKVGDETREYVLKKINSSGTNTTTTNTFPSNGTDTASTTRKWGGRTGTRTGAGENQKVYIKTGLTNDVDTEIVEDETSQIHEGDMIVSKTIDGGTTSKTTTTFSLFGGGGGNRGFGGGGNGGARTGTTNTAR